MTPRLLLVLGTLLAGGLWLLGYLTDQRPADAARPSVTLSPAAAPPASKPPAPTASRLRSRPLVDGLTEAHYVALGMPGLSAGWDAPTLKNIAKTLETILAKNPSELPGADSSYGKAFFAKLRYTVERFHFQTSTAKLASFNAFRTVLPVYAKAYEAGYQCDRELGLLIGLQFELIAGFAEDPHFVTSPTDARPQVARDLDGNLWQFQGDAIYFEGGAPMLEEDIARLLEDLCNPALLRPEARLLGLRYAALHLPTVVHRLNITGLDSRFERYRAVEQSAEVRALYDTLISRVNRPTPQRPADGTPRILIRGPLLTK